MPRPEFPCFFNALTLKIGILKCIINVHYKKAPGHTCTKCKAIRECCVFYRFAVEKVCPW